MKRPAAGEPDYPSGSDRLLHDQIIAGIWMRPKQRLDWSCFYLDEKYYVAERVLKYCELYHLTYRQWLDYTHSSLSWLALSKSIGLDPRQLVAGKYLVLLYNVMITCCLSY